MVYIKYTLTFFVLFKHITFTKIELKFFIIRKKKENNK